MHNTTSTEGFVRVINDFLKEFVKNNKDSKIKFFYRGESSDFDEGRLTPSVYREGKIKESIIDRERVLLKEFYTRLPSPSMGSSHLQKTILAQHHGCPTRLLDVTSNPLVALFFACQKNPKEKEEKDGVVYVLGVNYDLISYEDDIEARILGSVPYLRKEDREILDKEISDSPPWHIQDRLLKEISHYSGFPVSLEQLTELSPLLRCNHLLKPQKFVDNRILAQAGAFILPGTGKDSIKEIKNLEKQDEIICVAVKYKKEILKQLDNIGINSETLYCDADSVSEYIKNKF